MAARAHAQSRKGELDVTQGYGTDNGHAARPLSVPLLFVCQEIKSIIFLGREF